MGIGELKLVVWGLFVLCLVCVCIGFDPVDNYLIDCGSNSNSSVDTRVFVSDGFFPKILSTPENILATTASNLISSPLGPRIYQTARIFSGDSTYTFSIGKSGRHWIRLHFYPFVYRNYNLSSASFSVSSEEFVLLNDFQLSNGSMVKEFSVNITGNSLVLHFKPSGNSFAFLNALEVVSVPDELITDDAQRISPNVKFQGLWRQALQTVHRVNIGGSLVTPANDTLGRIWVADQGFLLNKSLATTVSNVAAVNYVAGGPTSDIAPKFVYGTCAEMNKAVPNSNFNVTWQFDIDADFEYLIRFHFCDIVSETANQLYFNVYVDSLMVAQDFDLSELTSNTLAAPVYKDFIGKVSGTRKLSVSIGPSVKVPGAQSNAILNGLEIMKMNNTAGSLDAGPHVNVASQQKSKKKNAGVIAGAVAILLFCFLSTPLFPSSSAETYLCLLLWHANVVHTAGYATRAHAFQGSGSDLSNEGTTVDLYQKQSLEGKKLC